MSIALMSAIWPLEMDSTPKFVLLSLADQANDSGECWPSVANLAKRTGLSERTVQYAIKQLVADGRITISERAGRSTIFTVQTPATVAPPNEIHPRSHCTPPPQPVHPTPATIAPGGATGAPRTQRNRQGTQKEPKGALAVPDWVPSVEWSDFIESRKEKGGVTSRAMGLLVKRLDELRRQGFDPGAVLNQSTMNGWKGLFPLKAQQNGATNARFDPAKWNAERLARIVDGSATRPVAGDVWDQLPAPVSEQ